MINFRGGESNISCTASGLPLPTVQWFKNGEVLNLTDRIFTVEVNESNSTNGIVMSTLVFSSLELSDNASYHCGANNTGAPGNVFIVNSTSSFIFITRKYYEAVLFFI